MKADELLEIARSDANSLWAGYLNGSISTKGAVVKILGLIDRVLDVIERAREEEKNGKHEGH